MIDSLAPRERELPADVGEGLTNKEIALRRYISLQTVKNHLDAISNKLGSRNRVEHVNHSMAAELERLRMWRERELAKRAEV